MRERLSFLVKDVWLYGGGMALGRLFALVTVPLLTRHFLPRDFGLIDIYNTLALFLMAILVFGMDSGVARYIFKTDCQQERRNIASEVVNFHLISSVIACVFVLISSDWLMEIQIVPFMGSFEWKLLAIYIPFLVILNFCQNLLKWSYARSKYLIISVGMPACIALATYISVLGYSVDIEIYLYLVCAITGIFAALALWFVSDWLKLRWAWSNFKGIAVYSFPYAAIAATTMFVPIYERTAVAAIGENELGFYAAGAKVALITTMVTQAFQMAWGPFSLAIHKSGNAWKTYNYVLRAYSTFILASVLLLAAVSDWLINILASAVYYDGRWVVFPLTLSIATISLSSLIEVGISISMRTHYLIYGQFINIASILTIMPLVGPKYGFIGIAFIVAIGNITRAAHNIYQSIRLNRHKWKIRPVVVDLCLVISFGFSGTLIGIHEDRHIATGVFVAGAIAVLLYGWLTLPNVARNYARQIFKTAFSRFLRNN